MNFSPHTIVLDRHARLRNLPADPIVEAHAAWAERAAMAVLLAARRDDNIERECA